MDQNQSPTSPADLLVVRVLAGETLAYADLIRHYEGDVWRIVVCLLQDRDAAENLVQQIFVDAYLGLRQYQLGSDFGAWIRTLARNRIRKELRTLMRQGRRLEMYRIRLTERLQAESPGHDDSEEYLTALRDCRDELPVPEATVLGLRYERGMTFEAIALVRGQTPEAIQRMLSRIRFRLRACIEGKLKTP
jgi:RNA polymerase sigma-70 factor, ECF subfamily